MRYIRKALLAHLSQLSTLIQSTPWNSCLDINKNNFWAFECGLWRLHRTCCSALGLSLCSPSLPVLPHFSSRGFATLPFEPWPLWLPRRNYLVLLWQSTCPSQPCQQTSLLPLGLAHTPLPGIQRAPSFYKMPKVSQLLDWSKQVPLRSTKQCLPLNKSLNVYELLFAKTRWLDLQREKQEFLIFCWAPLGNSDFWIEFWAG